jgi:hypothetical protein
MNRLLLLITYLGLAAPYASATCKSVQLRDQLVAENCIEEKLDTRGLPFIVGVRQTITSVDTAPIAVWSYFDVRISADTFIYPPTPGPQNSLHRYVLKPGQSRSFYLAIQTLPAAQLSAGKFYDVWLWNPIGVSKDLGLKTLPPINEGDWTEEKSSFLRKRLLPTPTEFVVDKKAIEASSPSGVAPACDQRQSQQSRGVTIQACVSGKQFITVEFANQRAEPIYIACPKNVAERILVLAQTPGKLYSSAKHGSQEELLFLLRPTQSMQMQAALQNVVPKEKAVQAITIRSRCVFDDWFQPRSRESPNSFQFEWE